MARVRLIRDNRPQVRRMARDAMRASLVNGAVLMAGQARLLVPVDTGALLRSISVKPTGVLRYSVIVDQEYALAVEAGTSRQDPQPYLVPASLWVASMLPSIARRNYRRLASR